MAALVKPCIVRDPFCDGHFSVYVPADDTGTYWNVVSMGYPFGTDDQTPSAKHLTILGMTYGVVRSGRSFVGYGAGWGTEGNTAGGGGTWSDQSAAGSGTNGDYYFRRSQTLNDFVDIAIPAGHNVIHLGLYDVVGSGTVGITWDDGSTDGLDITSYESGSDNTVKEVVVATNASPDGVKKLRLKMLQAVYMRILGVRSWNTALSASPSEVSAGTQSIGNSLVTLRRQALVLTEPVTDPITTQTSSVMMETEGSDSSVTLLTSKYMAAYEFAIQWDDSVGDDFRFTGGNNHMIAKVNPGGNWPYALDAAYSTDGPELIADSVNKGGIYNTTNQPRGTVYEAGQISIRSNGTADHASIDPAIEWGYSVDASGFGYSISIEWAGDVAFNPLGLMYSQMLAMNDDYNTSSSYLLQPTSNTKNLLNADLDLDPTSSVEIVYGGEDVVVKLGTTTPAALCQFINDKSKYYTHIDPVAMAGGETPADGDVWVIADRIEVRRLASNGSESWQGIGGGGNRYSGGGRYS